MASKRKKSPVKKAKSPDTTKSRVKAKAKPAAATARPAASSKAKTKAKPTAKAKTTVKSAVKGSPKAKQKTQAKASTKTKVKAKTAIRAKAKTATKAKTKTETKARRAKPSTSSKAAVKALSTVAAGAVAAGAAPRAATPAKRRAKAKVKTTAAKVSTAVAVKAARASHRKSVADTPDSFEPYSAHQKEDYMNEGQRQHFREILMNWKRQLMEEVDRTVSYMKDAAANDPDPADRATQEEEFSLELRTRDRERQLIKKIDSTVDLIDQNNYGYCESCGVEIGIRRLEARPTATQCIDCKTLDEIKERQILG
jgi:DnaK suppressor protein